jgi:SAM-dependent methyltransferase
MGHLLRSHLSPETKSGLRTLRQWFRRRTVYRIRPRHRWGGLRRTSPLHDGWGRDGWIDRIYIDEFIARHAADIRGDVLEVKNPRYATTFGQDGLRCHILDIEPTNSQATLIADLSQPDSLPPERFDCLILTQTLQLVRDPRVATLNAFRALRPGGVLLVSTPCASKIDSGSLAGSLYDDLWRFTPAGLGHLLYEVFPPAGVHVEGFGNVLTIVAFLMGLGANELDESELEVNDPNLPLVACARAQRPVADPSSSSGGPGGLPD